MSNFLLVAQFLPRSRTSVSMSLWLYDRDAYFLLHDLETQDRKLSSRDLDKKI